MRREWIPFDVSRNSKVSRIAGKENLISSISLFRGSLAVRKIFIFSRSSPVFTLRSMQRMKKNVLGEIQQ